MIIGDVPKQLASDSESMIFLNTLRVVVAALLQHGTTAQRPTRVLWIGRQYFDDTLGHPIWWDGAQWVTAAGVAA